MRFCGLVPCLRRYGANLARWPLLDTAPLTRRWPDWTAAEFVSALLCLQARCTGLFEEKLMYDHLPEEDSKTPCHVEF